MSPIYSTTRSRQASIQLENVDQQIAELEGDLALVDKRRAFLVTEIAEARKTEPQVQWIADHPSMRTLAPGLWAEQQNPSQEIKFYLETSTALPGGGRLYGEQLLVDEVFFTCMTGFKAKNDGQYIEILKVLLRKMDAAAENGLAALESLHEQEQICQQNLARSHWQAVFSSSQIPKRPPLKRAPRIEVVEVEEEEADGELDSFLKSEVVAQRPRLRRQRGSGTESVGSFGSLDQFLHEAFVRYDSDDDMVDENSEEESWCGQEEEGARGSRSDDQAKVSGGTRERFDSLLTAPLDLISNLF